MVERDQRPQQAGRVARPKRSRYEYLYHRWRFALAHPAKSKTAIGAFDFEISLALEFHWTPDQIYALDPDYVDELRAAMLARTHHERERAPKPTVPEDDDA